MALTKEEREGSRPRDKQVNPARFLSLGTNFLGQGFREIKGVPPAGDCPRARSR